jgi:hypothetical protein
MLRDVQQLQVTIVTTQKQPLLLVRITLTIPGLVLASLLH